MAGAIIERAMTEPDLSRYRPNVGAALFNAEGLVFVGRRLGDRLAYPWQMPQGGMDPGEAPETAVLRELAEETGVLPELVAPLGAIERWLTYDFPPEVRADKTRKGRDWVGQKQRWFAFKFLGSDADVDLEADATPEFDAWRWERLETTPSLIIPWKRAVYEEVAQAFAAFAR